MTRRNTYGIRRDGKLINLNDDVLPLPTVIEGFTEAKFILNAMRSSQRGKLELVTVDHSLVAPHWMRMEYEKTKMDDGSRQLFWERDRFNWWCDAQRLDHPTRYHFPHVSNADPTMLSYTPSFEYGQMNRHITTKPGRYLMEWYGKVLTPDYIRLLATQWTSEYCSINVKFASTPDDIFKVYMSGPRSCMSKLSSHYDGHCHPVRVYGNSDLQVAYLGNMDARVTARAVVWPERKTYTRIYGDDRLRYGLEKLGYLPTSYFSGARLPAIWDDHNDDHLIMPYLDGCAASGRLRRDENQKWYVIIAPDDDGHGSFVDLQCTGGSTSVD